MCPWFSQNRPAPVTMRRPSTTSVGVEEVAQRRPHLDELMFETSSPCPRAAGLSNAHGGLVDQRRVVVGVPRSQGALLVGVGKLLTPELADGHQHPEPGLIR